MDIKIKIQLSFMMFLEFFIWGGWFVTLGTFLGNNLNATGAESAIAFSTQSWGAIIAPFIIGLVADRYFNAERILGVLHLLGAVLMYQMYTAVDFAGFYPYILGYMILYMPTLALVNSISFSQMKNPAKATRTAPAPDVSVSATYEESDGGKVAEGSVALGYGVDTVMNVGPFVR